MLWMFVTSNLSSFTGYASCLYIRSCCQTVDFMLSSAVVVVVAVDLVAAKVPAKQTNNCLPACPAPFVAAELTLTLCPGRMPLPKKVLG